ncbi:MAG: hypothetical protein HYX37_12525 [Rhizobiales bacterium]|nr:hypothetical protein [Hyphomicrobiales bacterium]
MKQSKWWSWPIFFEGFFNGFGKGMAGQIALLFALMPFYGTENANFGSAIIGLLFMAALSSVFGFDAGDQAVREWREKQASLSVKPPE